MSILAGRYGQVAFDSGPASPVNPQVIASINTWKLSLKTNYEDVSCFGDTNKVYVPGLRDISGSYGGFWNSAELTPIHASNLTTPGYLQLTPNSNEPTFLFGGLAYLDADIDCSMSAPKITGSFVAAGPWVTP